MNGTDYSSTAKSARRPQVLRPALISIWLAGATIGIAACGLIPGAVRPTHVDVRSQTLSNGSLVSLSFERPVGPVSAFITRGNWLVVSIVDSLIAIDDAGLSRPSFVDSVEVTRFPTSLQLAFRLTVRVADVEVVQDPTSNDVWISLFADRRERRPR